MPRPCKQRRICCQSGQRMFTPLGCGRSRLTVIELQLDELEAVRLSDHMGLYQQQAAELMGVSRATLGRILASGRAKLARMVVEQTALRIDGGNVEPTPEVYQQRCASCHSQHNPPQDSPVSNKEL